MKRTGTLRVSMGVSRLDARRLARASAGNPFTAATNFLANRGLDDGDFIWVTGTDGQVGSIQAMFISEAGLATPAIASVMDAAAFTATATKASAEAKKSRAKKSGGKRSSAKASSKKSNSKKSGKGSRKKQ